MVRQKYEYLLHGPVASFRFYLSVFSYKKQKSECVWHVYMYVCMYVCMYVYLLYLYVYDEYVNMVPI